MFNPTLETLEPQTVERFKPFLDSRFRMLRDLILNLDFQRGLSNGALKCLNTFS